MIRFTFPYINAYTRAHIHTRSSYCSNVDGKILFCLKDKDSLCFRSVLIILKFDVPPSKIFTLINKADIYVNWYLSQNTCHTQHSDSLGFSFVDKTQTHHKYNEANVWHFKYNVNSAEILCVCSIQLAEYIFSTELCRITYVLNSPCYWYFWWIVSYVLLHIFYCIYTLV